ncbi:MAG: hypothetical protein NTZ67_07355 [Gammaproteobacteria bacterium]|nr:hypothetical protein [Gammaproteobacteria bacterium]
MPKYILTAADRWWINVLHRNATSAKKYFHELRETAPKENVKNLSYTQIVCNPISSNVSNPTRDEKIPVEVMWLDCRIRMFNRLAASSKSEFVRLNYGAKPTEFHANAVKEGGYNQCVLYPATVSDMLDSFVKVCSAPIKNPDDNTSQCSLEETKPESTLQAKKVEHKPILISRQSSLFAILGVLKKDKYFSDYELNMVFNVKSDEIKKCPEYNVTELKTAYLSHASFFTRQGKIFDKCPEEVIKTLQARAKKDPKGASAETLRDFGFKVTFYPGK